MNAQKESLKKTSREFEKNCRSQVPGAMKMKVEELELEEKNDGRLKYFLMEGRVYKVRAENSCHGLSNDFRSTILHTLKVLFV